MRISDWSSDVCSSDLAALMAPTAESWPAAAPRSRLTARDGTARRSTGRGARRRRTAGRARRSPPSRSSRAPHNRARSRSEEHTSELQSLMRISYAVFCLKKKMNYTTYIYTQIYKHNVETITQQTQ